MYNKSPMNPRDTHLYVASTIRQAIKNGKYSERLPSMSDLARTHRVSRSVIGRALNILKNEGLVEPLQGVAWYITGTVDTRPADVRIREALTELGFQKGQGILSETELGRYLGLSRITIRKGLAHLEGEGIVSAATPRGRTLL